MLRKMGGGREAKAHFVFCTDGAGAGWRGVSLMGWERDKLNNNLDRARRPLLARVTSLEAVLREIVALGCGRNDSVLNERYVEARRLAREALKEDA